MLSKPSKGAILPLISAIFATASSASNSAWSSAFERGTDWPATAYSLLDIYRLGSAGWGGLASVEIRKQRRFRQEP